MVRARQNLMIQQGKWEQGTMPSVAANRGDAMFACLIEKLLVIQCVARELTPGPKGSGED